MLTVFGIKNCDSVKKARRFLEDNNVAYTFHDFRVDGLDKSLIESWLEHTDWETLLNKRSTSWKQLSDEQRNNMSLANFIECSLELPTLIKRPVCTGAHGVLVGFNAASYQQFI